MTAETTRIEIGALSDHVSSILELGDGGDFPLVCDPHVWDLHGHRVRDLLPVEPIFVPRGEDAKNWATLQSLVGSLATLNHPRTRPIIALGGGSVGDVTGLVASLYRRGCPVIHLPTTLLAQVDSAVGGKTAIDAEGEKNIVGTFHLPAMVVADPAFLATLDERQLRAGIAEVAKYGAIGDPDFFAWTSAHVGALLAADPDTCARAASRCIAAKQSYVADDLHDLGGRRALLNFGHTFGHAIEALAGFGTVLHGEAVGLGMMLATRFSERVGLAEPGSVELMADFVARAGLPSRLSQVDLGGRGKELLPLMQRDKKNVSDNPRLILLKRIGEAIMTDDIEPGALAAFLEVAG